MNVQSFLTERDVPAAPPAATNRPNTELPSTLFGHPPCTVLKGSVIAESDHDLVQLLARQRPPRQRQNGSLSQALCITKNLQTRNEYAAASEVRRTAETRTTGSMMELEYVPKARLLVRYPMQRSLTTPVEGLKSVQTPSMSAAAFLRSASASSYGTLGFEGSGVVPYGTVPNRRMYDSVGMSWSDVHVNMSEVPNGLMSDPRLGPPPQMNCVLDVNRLGSLRYQNLGESLNSPSACFQQGGADSFPDNTMQNGGGYDRVGDPYGSGAVYDQLCYQHPFAQPSQPSSMYPLGCGVGKEYRRAAYERSVGVMVPTPIFVMGEDNQAKCGGPIELPNMRTGNSETSNRSSLNKLSPRGRHNIGQQGDPPISEFVDRLFDSPKNKANKTKKARKNNKENGKGVTKTKTINKNQKTTNKRQAAGKKASVAKSESFPEPLLAVGDINTTLYDRIISQQPDDPTSDATCLLWIPQLADALIRPFERGEGLRSSERDDVSEVFRLMEDAGLETLPKESSAIPLSCPILPPPSHLAPSTPDDVLELAFCCLGKAIASAEELQTVMKSWLEVTAKGPSRNPGLELWKGLDHVKVFTEQTRGHERIVTSLTKYTNRFQKSGVNGNGQGTWECINLGFFDRYTAVAQNKDGKLTTASNSRNCETRKRKKAASPPKTGKASDPSAPSEGHRSRRVGGSDEITHVPK